MTEADVEEGFLEEVTCELKVHRRSPGGDRARERLGGPCEAPDTCSLSELLNQRESTPVRAFARICWEQD